MLQNISTVEYKHKKFIERVVEFQTVWGLNSEEGWATSCSNVNEHIEVIPFWSDRAYASACVKGDWITYKPESMSLTMFLENWCIGMHNDQVLAGTNWDANLFGKEVQPLRLAFDLLQHAKSTHQTITVTRYKSVEDFENQVNEVLKRFKEIE